MELRVSSPFPAYAWPLVWDWIQSFRSRVCDDFAPKDQEEFVQRYLAVSRLPHVFTFAVERDGELGGVIWFERTEIAGIIHVIFKKSFWGGATTMPALAQVADALFQNGTRKINALFFSDNHAVRAVVKQFGFVQEGLLRSQTLRDGRPVDMEPWGLLKEEFYGNRNRYRGLDHGPAGSGSLDSVGPDKQGEDQHEHVELSASVYTSADGHSGKAECGDPEQAEQSGEPRPA